MPRGPRGGIRGPGAIRSRVVRVDAIACDPVGATAADGGALRGRPFPPKIARDRHVDRRGESSSGGR